METAVFIVAAVLTVLSALGVILARNPVHSVLMLMATLFAVAVLFVALDAHFLAAVQIIVYAGAIVILFLFVVMLLGVDVAENLRVEPIGGQRPLAIGATVSTAVLTILIIIVAASDSREPTPGKLVGLEEQETSTGVANLGKVIFNDYLWAFEIIAVLLTIGVIGAVLLTQRSTEKDSAEKSSAEKSSTEKEREA